MDGFVLRLVVVATAFHVASAAGLVVLPTSRRGPVPETSSRHALTNNDSSSR